MIQFFRVPTSGSSPVFAFLSRTRLSQFSLWPFARIVPLEGGIDPSADPPVIFLRGTVLERCAAAVKCEPVPAEALDHEYADGIEDAQLGDTLFHKPRA